MDPLRDKALVTNECSQLLRNYANLLQQCGNRMLLSNGRALHCQIVAEGLDRNTFLANHLIMMYGRCHSTQDARKVFEKINERNIYSWNSIMTAYAHNGHYLEAWHLFRLMQCEGFYFSDVTLVIVISACPSLQHLRSIHPLAVSTGFIRAVPVSTAMINMYSKCGYLHEARMIFNDMKSRNVITWNVMIAGYAQHGRCKEAIDLFMQLDATVLPNSFTFSSLLSACRNVEGLQETKLVHSNIAARGLCSDVIIGSMLIDTYARCGSLKDSQAVCESFKQANMICWTAMSGAYVHHGCGEEALHLLRRMDQEGFKADVTVFFNTLRACTITGDLKQGRRIHIRAVLQGLLDVNDILATALANMYCKCGSLNEGRQVFNGIQCKDSVSWNEMITAFAQHGEECETAVEIFREMLLDGTKVTDVSYLNALHSCSHKGLVEKAWELFTMMMEENEVEATVKHYRCMVDILARAGRLEEAKELMNSMPFEPGFVAWKALTAGCWTHGESKQGALAARSAIRLEPDLSQAYVMLFNACGANPGFTSNTL